MANEVQRFAFGTIASPVTPEDGTYTLTFDGYTTGSINYYDNEAAIIAALEALTSIGSGNVNVTLASGVYSVEFQGTLADTNVPEITASAGSIKQAADTVQTNTVISGSAGTNEIQLLDLTGVTTGDFYLNWGGNASQVTVFDVSTIQGACDAIVGTGNTTVTDNFNSTFSIGFQGGYAGQDVAEMTISGNTTDGSPSVSTTTNGVAGTSQVVGVVLSDNPTEGTLNVTLDATTSADFYYNDTSPATISGWSGGGSAGNWEYTADTQASDVSHSGSEGSSPLRKSPGIEIDTLTQGSGGSGAIAGTCSITFAGINSLLGTGTLTGSVTLVFGGTDTLVASGVLAGSSNPVFGGTASLLANDSLAGNSILTFDGTNTLSGIGLMVVSTFSPFSFQDYLPSTLTGSGSLAGSSALVFDGTATVSASGNLTASSAITFSNSASLLALAELVGSTVLTFSGTNTLTGSGSLIGSAGVEFGDPGTTILSGTGVLLGSSVVIFSVTGTIELRVLGVGSFENVAGPSPTFPFVSGSPVFQTINGSNSGTFPIVKTKG